MVSALAGIFTTWRTRIALLLVALVAVGCAFNPLTNHLGYAAALIAAITVSAIGAALGSGLPACFRHRDIQVSAGHALTAAFVVGASTTALFGLVVAFAGLVTNPCAPAHGALFFLVMPLPAGLTAALLGVAISTIVRRTWLATIVAELVILASIVGSLVRFYQSPTIFSYDPFFGYFPGAFYDETISLTPTLITYRLGTVGALIGLSGLISALWQPTQSTWSLQSLGERTASACVAALGFALMFAVYLAGPALGHRHSASDISAALGGRIEGPRCVVIYARSIPAREARLTQRDCEVRVGQLETFFDVRVQRQITVFLFADAAQKQQLMGAADTYIAKPWRYEVYLQFEPFPHPVLKHELAHVVAGEMATGPMRVTTRWGLIPLPGLIEGAAVAAAWEGEGDASPHQWTRAMLEAQMLPPLSVLTGLGFFSHGAGTAYTAAGSFSRWLIEHYGAAKYHTLYRSGDFDQAYGKPLSVLEHEWHAFLQTVETPERLLVRARTRFRRAALTARVCPHESAEMLGHAAERLAAGDLTHAREELVTVVANDPTDLHARMALAESWARLGDVPRALAVTDAAGTDLGPAAGSRLRSRVADLVWRWRGIDEARVIYAGLDTNLLDEDDARTLEIKRWALGLMGTVPDRQYANAVQDLLIGRGELEPDSLAATERLTLEFRGANRDDRLDAPAAYLVGRQLESHHRSADAVAILSTIDPTQLPSDRVRTEARRLEALSRFMSGDRDGALRIFTEIAENSAIPQGIRNTALDWADRIRRTH